MTNSWEPWAGLGASVFSFGFVVISILLDRRRIACLAAEAAATAAAQDALRNQEALKEAARHYHMMTEISGDFQMLSDDVQQRSVAAFAALNFRKRRYLNVARIAYRMGEPPNSFSDIFGDPHRGPDARAEKAKTTMLARQLAPR